MTDCMHDNYTTYTQGNKLCYIMKSLHVYLFLISTDWLK